MVKIGAAQFRNLKKCPHRTPKKPEFGHKWSIKPGFPLVDLFYFAYLNSPYRDLKMPHSRNGRDQPPSAVLKKAGIRHFRHYPLPTRIWSSKTATSLRAHSRNLVLSRAHFVELDLVTRLGGLKIFRRFQKNWFYGLVTSFLGQKMTLFWTSRLFLVIFLGLISPFWTR